MSATKTPRDVLIAAKALIDTPERWCKGTYEDGHGRHCAVGAVCAVEDIEPPYGFGLPDPALGQLRRALPPRWRRYALTEFNDARNRKHAQIMAWFDRAIEASS